MLMPKRVKRRRVHRGRMTGKCTKGNKIAYGDYGLVGARTRLDQVQPDRGGPCRDDEIHKERR